MVVLLVGSAAAIAYSFVLTVRLFKSFGTQETNDERIARLRGFKKKVILSYAAAVLMMTAAALVKLL